MEGHFCGESFIQPSAPPSLFQMRTLWHSLCLERVMEKVTALTGYLCPASRIPSAKLLRQPSWNWTNHPQLIIYQVKGRGKGRKAFWSEKIEYFPFFLWEKSKQQFWGLKIGQRTVLKIVRLWFLNSLTRASVGLKQLLSGSWDLQLAKNAVRTKMAFDNCVAMSLLEPKLSFILRKFRLYISKLKYLSCWTTTSVWPKCQGNC